MNLALALVLAVFTILPAYNSVLPQRRGRVNQPPPRSPQKSTSNAADKPSYDVQPFDLKQERLPPGYRGQDIASIYKVIEARKTKLTKDEFETTDAYKARVQKEMEQPITARLGVQDVLAFQGSKYDMDVSYNADHQTLKVAVKSDELMEGFARFNSAKRSFTVEKIFDDEHSYQASNALGAQVRVKVHDSQTYGISFSNFRSFVEKYVSEDELKTAREYGLTPLSKDAVIENLRLDVPAAKEAKDNLRSLFICRLVQPLTSSGAAYKEARIQVVSATSGSLKNTSFGVL